VEINKTLPADTTNNHEECSKTTKALQVVLGNLPDTDELERLKKTFMLNRTSRYYKSKYDYQLTRVQTTLLKAVSENKKKIKSNLSSEEKESIERKQKVALKLLKSWKITVHL